MTIEINPNAKKILKNGLKKISCPYSGKILSPEEIKEMGVDHLPHKPFFKNNAIKRTLTPEEKVKMQEYIKALDKMIEKNPDNIDLRTYRAKIVAELKNFS